MITGKQYFDQLFSTASQAHQSGDLVKAAALYRQLIKDIPNQSEPYHLLAVIESCNGKYEKAIVLFERAIALHPNHPVYRNNCAEALQRIDQNELAIQHLQKALAIDANFYLAKHKLASVYKKIEFYEKAELLFKEVIAQKPDFHPAFFQLGTQMLQTGNYQSAKTYLHQAVDLDANAIMAINNLAVVYQELEDFENAILYYQKAHALNPQYEDAIRNLGLLNERLGYDKEAKKYFVKLAEIHDQDPLTLWKSEIITPHVFESTADVTDFHQQILKQLDVIKQKRVNINVDQLTKLDIHPPSVIIYDGLDDLPIKQAYAELFKSIPRIVLPDIKNEKPKIGFVVTSGHEGVFLKCMIGILNNISTEILDVYIICSFPNGQRVIQPNIKNDQIKFVNLPKSLEQSVKILASLNFDLLYYWEVGTDAYNYFIPYFKPAKVQCTSWGWPTSSGIPTMDYYISAKSLDDENSQQHYTEKLVFFERLPLCYAKPEIPLLDMSRSDFGLLVEDKVYLCTQNVRKVTPEFDSIVGQILTGDPSAVVVFLGDKISSITEKLKTRLISKHPDFRERIRVLERLENKAYFNLINSSDVILDTIHYSGGANTNYDAFALGKLVVTWPTHLHRSKFTAAAYHQIGMMDLIATDEGAYVSLAMRIANDDHFRRSITEKIEQNAYQLFDDIRAVRELEDFVLAVTK